MSIKHTAAGRRGEVEFQSVIEKWRTIRLITTEIGRIAAIGIPCYFAYRSISEIAGKTTAFSFLVQLLSDKYFANSVMAIATAASIFYGLNERRLRKKVIERDHERVQELENIIDTNRSSAALSKAGNPLPR